MRQLTQFAYFGFLILVIYSDFWFRTFGFYNKASQCPISKFPSPFILAEIPPLGYF
jgi:hypothetical protein